MLLAIDFDGTIAEHRYPAIGRPVAGAIDTLLKLQRDGHRFILWTCREGRALDDAIIFCRERGIEFESYNENRFELLGRKVYADYYIDDRNICGFPGWDNIYAFIKKKQNELEAAAEIVNVKLGKAALSKGI